MTPKEAIAWEHLRRRPLPPQRASKSVAWLWLIGGLLLAAVLLEALRRLA